MTKPREIVKEFCSLCGEDVLTLCFDQRCPNNDSFFNDNVLERLPPKNSCALKHEGGIVAEENNELILI